MKIWRLCTFNWSVLAGFELIYKFLTAAVFAPAFTWVFHQVMTISGYEYITPDNVGLFMKNPATLAMVLVLLLLMTVYAMIDIGAVIFVLNQSAREQKTDLYQTVAFALKNAGRVFRRKNWAIAGLVLFLIPFLHIGITSGFVSTLSIPSFIMKAVRQNWKWMLLAGGLALLLGILLLRWLYVFHYFSLEDCEFREAARRSTKLSRGKSLSDFLMLAVIQGLSALAYFAIAGIWMLLVIEVKKLLIYLKVLNIVSVSVVWGLRISMLIVGTMVAPVSYGAISLRYYYYKEQKKEPVVYAENRQLVRKEKSLRWLRFVEKGLLLAAAAGCVYLAFDVFSHKMEVPVEYVKTMQVTAHRGASWYYPENTMAAFEGAKEQGADWIELDVQQTRDGQLIVLHDKNLKRTAGVNQYVWDTDYREMETMDVGSSFGTEFAGERIPLLTEVMEFARDNEIRLNIELKPSGKEVDFEQQVVDVIREMKFENQCVVASQNYHVLQNIKDIDENITTVYVMGLAYGNISRLSAADHFSVEASNVTERLVSHVHNEGKQIYVWTVNTKSAIRRMIDMRVDNIVTDDVLLAQECIYESMTSDGIHEYVEFLRGY